MIDSIVEVLKQGIMTIALLNPTVEDLRNDVYIDVPAFCMAQNIYHEARGEPRIGKIAVAHVTLNRVSHSSYPNTICDVVYDGPVSTWFLEERNKIVPIRHGCQFSWWCDGRSDMVGDQEAWQDALNIALLVMARIELDPTNGATHYWNPDKVNKEPNWGYPVVAYIGDHIFCKRPSRA